MRLFRATEDLLQFKTHCCLPPSWTHTLDLICNNSELWTNHTPPALRGFPGSEVANSDSIKPKNCPARICNFHFIMLLYNWKPDCFHSNLLVRFEYCWTFGRSLYYTILDQTPNYFHSISSSWEIFARSKPGWDWIILKREISLNSLSESWLGVYWSGVMRVWHCPLLVSLCSNVPPT